MSDSADRLAEALAGRYSIERELGQGGMATVYLAEDLRHHRKVAIKVLRPEISSVVGTERFLREIDIAAGLNHPLIMPLFDSGRTGGAEGGEDLLYYVMPFVQGETLSDRLAHEHGLPVRTAVRILRDIVDALAAAHKQGVIHRDVKPGNVMLLDQHAVVTDFGIAKAVREAAGRDTVTTAGMALGTPRYMAPEQAAGSGEVDHRADLYSVGVLAYEMLTGVPPFSGTTPQAMLVAHLAETPRPVEERRPSVPKPLADAIMRCLAKNPADRWQSAEELLAHLDALFTPSEELPPVPPLLPLMRRRRRAALAGAGAVVLVAALGVGAWWLMHRPQPIYVFGRSVRVTSRPGLEIQPTLSPDGKFVAYAAGNAAHMRIYIRTITGGRTIPLSDDSTDVEFQPRWSPDGDHLLYLTNGGVSVAPALGGSSRPVVGPSQGGGKVVAAAWSPDGKRIAFARGDSLLVVPVAGGAARLLAVTSGPHACSWSLDGRWIACADGNRNAAVPGEEFGNTAPSRIVLVPAGGGNPIPITGNEALNESPVWSPKGLRLFFVSNRNGPRDVYAQQIGSDGHPAGRPVRVTTGLNAQSLSISASGTRFAYDVYTARSNIWTLPIPPAGAGPVDADRARQLTTGDQLIESMRPSPDDKWLLYDSNLSGNADIYRIPIGGGQAEQLTSEPWDEFAPSLSPDGRLLAYHSFRTGTRDIEVKPLDGSPVEEVTHSPGQESYPVWSPDGRRLLFYDQSSPDVMLVSTRLAPGSWSRPDTIGRGWSAQWSPDGREIGYLGNDSTATGVLTAIFTRPFPAGPPSLLYVDTGGAGSFGFVWARDGRMYVKTHDAAGHASIWQMVNREPLRPLVRFPNLDRPSNRRDFAADRKRFYFTFEDRESDVFVVDVTRR